MEPRTALERQPRKSRAPPQNAAKLSGFANQLNIQKGKFSGTPAAAGWSRAPPLNHNAAKLSGFAKRLKIQVGKFQAHLPPQDGARRRLGRQPKGVGPRHYDAAGRLAGLHLVR